MVVEKQGRAFKLRGKLDVASPRRGLAVVRVDLQRGIHPDGEPLARGMHRLASRVGACVANHLDVWAVAYKKRRSFTLRSLVCSFVFKRVVEEPKKRGEKAQTTRQQPVFFKAACKTKAELCKTKARPPALILSP